jgi:hypothetical protein
MTLLAEARDFGTRLDGKPKTARLYLRLSAIHGGEVRARCDAVNERAVGGFDAIIEGQFTTRKCRSNGGVKDHSAFENGYSAPLEGNDSAAMIR